MTTPETPASPARPSARWLRALRHASSDLAELVADLSEDDLRRASFAKGWTLADLLSHLGSGAEISAMLVRRGLEGSDQGPQREELVPIWDRWNALPPGAQRDAWLESDAAHLELLSSIGPETEQSLRIPYFAGPMDLETYLGYRLSEHAIHGWDAEVAFVPTAAVQHVDLLWERLDLVVNRFHDSDARSALPAQQIALVRTDAEGKDAAATLDITTGGLSLRHGAATSPLTTAAGTSDSLLRLIYGRHRDGDAVQVTGTLSLDQLVGLFPGF